MRPSPLLSRLSILATLAACLIITVGGLVTTNGTLTSPLDSFLLSATGHQRIAEMAGTVVMLYLIWAGIAAQGKARLTAWATLTCVLATGAFGFLRGEGLFASPLWGTLHASLAALIVTGTAAIGVVTSRWFCREPELVEDYGWPSMRSLGKFMPYLVFTQILLGAAFRQGAMGLMYHILGAMAVSMYILMVGAFLLNQFPQHRPLAPAARVLLGAIFTQVFFGITAFTVRSMPEEPVALLVVTGAHVVVGALTLAASVVVSILIARHVMPKGSLSKAEAVQP